jgi:predicted nucleotidyltransferase component of viral defense system
MSAQNYENQVRLLLDIMPAIAEESCFAMHGGTAINLFVRDMPRLSVDIDLTYVLIEDRATTLANIRQALVSIQTRLRTQSGFKTVLDEDHVKLKCVSKNAEVKIEVNTTMRGTLTDPVRMRLSRSAGLRFDRFVETPIVPVGQLYGGKTCAALARQHPRDLFDIRHMLDALGFTDEIKRGFLLCLLSSDKPINDMIMPSLLDQRQAMTKRFSGMTAIPFSYEDFEETRRILIKTVNECLNENDREFLLSFKAGNPDWIKYGYPEFEKFPAVQWKLKNIQTLKTNNPSNHRVQLDRLRESLSFKENP